FMDEPTIGLDPLGAQEVRQLVPELVRQGKTILLTTHYMFEADSLCDRVAIINHGRLVAEGTPRDIKRTFSQAGIVELTVKQARPELAGELGAIEGVQRTDRSPDGIFERIIIQYTPGVDVRPAITAVAGLENIQSLVERDPTLEEAYLNILR
ncbi:MAG TPA: ABC transporter ATP-binding protein, partial [Chloroflexota bacterium]|nr:ABC transporter ATP-binding protein [Chloroflexota bacterium]